MSSKYSKLLIAVSLIVTVVISISLSGSFFAKKFGAYDEYDTDYNEDDDYTERKPRLSRGIIMFFIVMITIGAIAGYCMYRKYANLLRAMMFWRSDKKRIECPECGNMIIAR